MPRLSVGALVLSVLGCSLAAGCGEDDDSDAAGGGPSGVPGQKLLTELTKADNQKLCEYGVEQYRRLALASKEQYCTVVGIDTSGTEDSCEESKQDCIDGTDYEDELAYDGDCATRDFVDEDIEGPCTATVADVEACIREDAEREGAIGMKYTCADTDAVIPEEQGEGPACAKVSANCPEADF